MLGEDLEAATAAARMGYNDAAHFNREYKSHFGVPPARNVHWNGSILVANMANCA